MYRSGLYSFHAVLSRADVPSIRASFSSIAFTTSDQRPCVMVRIRLLGRAVGCVGACSSGWQSTNRAYANARVPRVEQGDPCEMAIVCTVPVQLALRAAWQPRSAGLALVSPVKARMPAGERGDEPAKRTAGPPAGWCSRSRRGSRARATWRARRPPPTGCPLRRGPGPAA